MQKLYQTIKKKINLKLFYVDQGPHKIVAIKSIIRFRYNIFTRKIKPVYTTYIFFIYIEVKQFIFKILQLLMH